MFALVIIKVDFRDLQVPRDMGGRGMIRKSFAFH